MNGPHQWHVCQCQQKENNISMLCALYMRTESLNRNVFIFSWLHFFPFHSFDYYYLILIFFLMRFAALKSILHPIQCELTWEWEKTRTFCANGMLWPQFEFVQLIWAAASNNLIYQSTFNFLMWFFLLVRVCVCVCLIECEIQWRTFNSGDWNWDYRTVYCRCCCRRCCWFCCSVCAFFVAVARHRLGKISKLLAQFNAVA